jgi:hypothetical protein
LHGVGAGEWFRLGFWFRFRLRLRLWFRFRLRLRFGLGLWLGLRFRFGFRLGLGLGFGFWFGFRLGFWFGFWFGIRQWFGELDEIAVTDAVRQHLPYGGKVALLKLGISRQRPQVHRQAAD